MLLGYLDQPATYETFLNNATWEKAFDWLHEHRNLLPDDGEYEIEGRDIRAIVQTIDLKPRAERVFEAHRREIDVHYCFHGSERIEWMPVGMLKAQTVYDAEKDFTLYDPPTNPSAITLNPGRFTIFLPADGHMPGILPGDYFSSVRKVVMKINVDLLKSAVAS